MEKTGKYHLNQAEKINITNNKTYGYHHIAPDMMSIEGNNISVGFFHKIYDLCLTMRKQKTNPNRGTF